jgi:hypothetical protein
MDDRLFDSESAQYFVAYYCHEGKMKAIVSKNISIASLQTAAAIERLISSGFVNEKSRRHSKCSYPLMQTASPLFDTPTSTGNPKDKPLAIRHRDRNLHCCSKSTKAGLFIIRVHLQAIISTTDEALKHGITHILSSVSHREDYLVQRYQVIPVTR